MAKIQRILMATDFSDHAHEAMKQAAALARALGAELVMCHVIEPLPFSAGTPPVPHASDPASDARALCEKWLTEFGIENGRALVEQGYAFAEIARVARNEEVDLVVLGSHGRGAIAHMLLGSVAERVARKAPCSVLVVREGQREFEFP
jgi:universal stress protein A